MIYVLRVRCDINDICSTCMLRYNVTELIFRDSRDTTLTSRYVLLSRLSSLDGFAIITRFDGYSSGV